MRYLGVIGYPSDYPISFSGMMVFDGNGNFTASGSGVYFNGSSSATVTPVSGTYSVFANGQVSITNPFAPASAGAVLYGGMGAGNVVVASSSESSYLDLFVAIPQGSSLSNSTLSGAYHVAGLEFAGGSLTGMRSVSFTAMADGNGNLGNLTLAGSSSALSDANTTQTISGATYSLTSNGTGTMTLPPPGGGVSTANQLISGSKMLYVSPDGSFFVSGSQTGWDMQLGVKAIASGGATIFSGLYYDAAVENYTGSNGGVDAWYGAQNELPTANPPAELVHERYNDSESGYPSYDYMYSDSFAPGSDGTSSAADYYFAVGANGNFAVQTVGQGDYYLQLYVKIPSFSGSGVFLNPTGIVNAASSSPFTAQLSPGEDITLYGTGFTSNSQPQSASLPFPTNLGGVQVMINNTPAPIFLVTPTQINAVVPYTIPAGGAAVTVQVISNGTPSNSVQAYTGLTSPGVFTVPPGGIGSGAILHSDYSLVSASSPAKMGETVQLFLNGLGAVSPTSVTAGSAAPYPTSLMNPVQVYIDDVSGNYTQATVTFSGLAPQLGGLYQINFTVPSGLTLNSSGATQFIVEISTADGDSQQATIPVSQ